MATPVPLCPLITSSCQSQEELLATEPTEIRAYKLSRQRWSYNCCRLDLHPEASRDQSLSIQKAVDVTAVLLPPELQESALAYRVELQGGGALALHVHLVYDSPRELEPLTTDGIIQRRFEWFCVSRAACSRGCQGPLLRTVQRFGPVGSRRSDMTDCLNLLKSPKHLHISIDEATSHQSQRRFRLIFGAFSPDGTKLLGTACSLPVRVVANNDVPQGPGTFQIHLSLSNFPSASMAFARQSLSEDPQTPLSPIVKTDAPADSKGVVSGTAHDTGVCHNLLLEMINSPEGNTYAAQHNATPVLLLMHACSSFQGEESHSSHEAGCLQLLGLTEIHQRYSEQVDHVQFWCKARQRYPLEVQE